MKPEEPSADCGNGDHESPFSGNVPESVVDHGWGDFRTWLIIIGLSVALIVTTLIMYSIIGKHTPQKWNLGTPPTAPNFISLW